MLIESDDSQQGGGGEAETMARGRDDSCDDQPGLFDSLGREIVDECPECNGTGLIGSVGQSRNMICCCILEEVLCLSR